MWFYSTFEAQQYRLFPKKSLKLEKIVFNFLSVSPNVAPKPTGQSRSHKKKIKIFIFSKMSPTIFIKFCGFIVHSNPRNMALSAFPRKILLTRKIFFNFLYAPNVAPKPTDQCFSNSIFRVLLQLSPVSPFHFRPSFNIKGTLMLRVVHIRNKKRTDWQTWSIVFVAMLLNRQERSPRKYCYQSSEICCL